MDIKRARMREIIQFVEIQTYQPKRKTNLRVRRQSWIFLVDGLIKTQETRKINIKHAETLKHIQKQTNKITNMHTIDKQANIKIKIKKIRYIK